MPQAEDILKTKFGYSDFRLHQRDIIQALIDGQDVLTLMPTGGGKSLCYQIPALIRAGAGVVISPLIALMQDQVDALNQLGIKAAYLNSSLDELQIRQTEASLTAGELNLIYIAPERLLTTRMLSLLDRTPIALFAIDEAHCVSQWGHDFRKEYQQLSVLHQRFPNVPRIALTATADQRTRREIIEQLELKNAKVFVNSFDRPNIHYTISDGQNARDQLWRFLHNEHSQDAGIVYCLSRNKVETIAQWLQSKGREALPYHAGLPDQVRRQNQDRFQREEGIIIVATIAFGMGIDKPDVRFVAHLNLPKSIEAYYQETGRAGRDGKPASAWMAYGLQDVITLRQWLQQADANEQYKRAAHNKLDAMLGLCELTSCRRQTLLSYFGETLKEACGNCDNCNNPPQTWQATEAAQKALSCVYRTGQRFGVNYVVDVLVGKDDDRIHQNRHHQLSTFGVGTDLNNVQWRSLFRQLIALDYLKTDVEGHGSLFLTDRCRPLLKGEVQLHLRKQSISLKEKQPHAAKSKPLRSCDEELYEALRTLRGKLANQQGVPAYVIFHDQTLLELARRRPHTANEMQYIHGVGELKLKRYGDAFIREIVAHPLPDLLNNNYSDTVTETLLLHLQGKDVDTIARQRDLEPATIYGHYAEAMADGRLDPNEVLDLDDDQYSEIVNTIELLDTCTTGSLKPVYEALNETYNYGILKCVLASI